MEEEYEDIEGYEDYEDVANVPGLKKKDDLYSLFKKVWRAPNSTKIANLSTQELGMLPMSVRGNQYLALLGTTFNHPDLADFFMGRSEIILATSMAKKGWFTGLFVTQKKFTSKASSQTMNLPETKKKWSIYNKSKPQQMPQV